MNDLGLGINDFVNVYGSLLFEVIRTHLKTLKGQSPVAGIKTEGRFQFIQEYARDVPSAEIKDAEVHRFISNNLDSSTGYVVSFETKLGNTDFKKDMRVKYNALRVTAGDIVLTVGSDKTLHMEIVKIRNEIVANYELRLSRLGSPRSGVGSSGLNIMRKSILWRGKERIR
ncbi:hypothetical protein [Candidatus Borreliella tachyglossi]|uniref:hypothetical protein n=1 Tax=Candidatus Borreliella tachyglossi TaxID=1964448 RepID=UPI0040420EC1